MLLKIYAIKDEVVGEFQSPIYMVNDGTAMRAVGNAVNSSQDNPVKENYKDKTLYCLGEFNSLTGEISSDIRFIVRLTELVQVGD